METLGEIVLVNPRSSAALKLTEGAIGYGIGVRTRQERLLLEKTGPKCGLAGSFAIADSPQSELKTQLSACNVGGSRTQPAPAAVELRPPLPEVVSGRRKLSSTAMTGTAYRDSPETL